MVARDGFGLVKDEPVPETSDVFGDEPPEDKVTEEAPGEETATEVEVEVETDAPEPALDETETEPEAETEGEPESETEEPAEAELPTPFLGKYKTVEAAEKAYNELRASERRAAEAERKLIEQNRQLDEYLRVAAQELQRRQEAPAPKTDAEVEAAAAAYGVDPETFLAAQKIAQEQVAQQLAPFQQQMTQQQQLQAQELARQQELEQVRQVASAWVAEQGDELDDETWTNVVQVFTELELDEHLPENYDVAREIASDPALRATLRAMPDLVESDEGMALARRLASDQQDTQPKPARRPRPNAHVERGPSGATPAAEPAKPLDSWERVMKLNEEEGKQKSSILGV